MRGRTTGLFTSHRCGTAIVCLSILGLAFSPAVLHAVPINHGDFSGTTVDFLDVTEDSNTPGDVPPLFGAPTVTGDSLDFNPVGFSASASGASGVDQTDGQLSFMIVAKSGKGIQTITLSEAGDTGLAGFGTDATYTGVRANVFVDILELNNAVITPINVMGSMTFTPSGGAFGLATDGGGGPTFNSTWTGGVLIDVGSLVPPNSVVTKVKVNLDNTLTALSEDGTSAFIAKKDFDGLVITVDEMVIPEPTTAILALSGMLALTCSRRRS